MAASRSSGYPASALAATGAALPGAHLHQHVGLLGRIGLDEALAGERGSGRSLDTVLEIGLGLLRWQALEGVAWQRAGGWPLTEAGHVGGDRVHGAATGQGKGGRCGQAQGSEFHRRLLFRMIGWSRWRNEGAGLARRGTWRRWVQSSCWALSTRSLITDTGMLANVDDETPSAGVPQPSSSSKAMSPPASGRPEALMVWKG